MLKRLIKYLNALGFFKSKKNKYLPFYFEENEKIVRSIFSPININKKTNRLKSNAFKPPAGVDEISVNRLSYTSVHFCKKISKEIQNPTSNRTYFGLALLYKNEIDQCNCSVYYTPKESNKYHSDIKIGYIPVAGVPLPSEYQYKITQLKNRSRFFVDPNPEAENWEGEQVE